VDPFLEIEGRKRAICYNQACSGGTAMAEQNFENHAKFVPAFHFFVIPLAAINFGWQIYRWKAGGFTLDGLESILLAAALLIGFLYARLFTLKVQDRVIRLEERLRCQLLLPADLQPRIAETNGAQSDQATHKELEIRLPARLAANSP
jgi:uncharacterized membrane protein YciS (DUF1049 family)